MSVCGLDKMIGLSVRTVIMGDTYIFFKGGVCVCVLQGPERFVLTSPVESAQLWFPWRTQVSFEVNEADWLFPSARSGSQTVPGGWTPDNPVNQDEKWEEELAVTSFTCQCQHCPDLLCQLKKKVIQKRSHRTAAGVRAAHQIFRLHLGSSKLPLLMCLIQNNHICTFKTLKTGVAIARGGEVVSQL